MKSGAEILQYIDDFYAKALERPFMYASSPQALEETFAAMDRVRDYVLGSGADDGQRNSYATYLQEKGYSAGLFTSKRSGRHALTEDEKKAFYDFCTFWRSYASQRSPR
jgi:hypothetical protein